LDNIFNVASGSVSHLWNFIKSVHYPLQINLKNVFNYKHVSVLKSFKFSLCYFPFLLNVISELFINLLELI
jgi:hypothetical protein